MIFVVCVCVVLLLFTKKLLYLVHIYRRERSGEETDSSYNSETSSLYTEVQDSIHVALHNKCSPSVGVK